MDQHLSYKPDWFGKENMGSYNEQANDNMILCKNLEIVALEVGITSRTYSNGVGPVDKNHSRPQC